MVSAQLTLNCRRFLAGYWAKSYASAKRHMFHLALCWPPVLAIFLACLGVLAIMPAGRHQPQTSAVPISNILYVLILETGAFATGAAVYRGLRPSTISSSDRRGPLRRCLSISNDVCTTVFGTGILLLLFYALIYTAFFYHSSSIKGLAGLAGIMFLPWLALAALVFLAIASLGTIFSCTVGAAMGMLVRDNFPTGAADGARITPRRSDGGIRAKILGLMGFTILSAALLYFLMPPWQEGWPGILRVSLCLLFAGNVWACFATAGMMLYRAPKYGWGWVFIAVAALMAAYVVWCLCQVDVLIIA